MIMVRKSKSFKQATDMTVDGAYADLVVPPRMEGDPTGQSTAIESQINAIKNEVAATGGMPSAAIAQQPVANIFDTPTQFPDEPGYVPEKQASTPTPISEAQVTKKILLDRFPELKYRFN
jgi:hypothetical protein